MSDKPKQKDKPRPPHSVKPTTAVMVVNSDQYGDAARREAFAAMVAGGIAHAQAFQVAWPEKEPTPQAIRYAAAHAQPQIQALAAQTAQGRAELHGITLSWALQELKEYYETPLADINLNSRFCRKHKITTTMTDNGPKETVEIEKDAPLAIMKTIIETAALALPSMGSAAELAMRERELESKEKGANTLQDFLASLVQNGSPIGRPVRDVETVVDVQD